MNVRRIARHARWHAARSGLYAARLTARVPAGAWRTTRWAWAWITDTAHHDAYTAAIRTASNPTAYQNLRTDHRDQTRRRATATLITLAVLAVVTAWAAAVTHPAVPTLVAVVALGIIGRARPVTDPVDEGTNPDMTQALITDTLVRLPAVGARIARELDADQRAVRYLTPVQRDGAGWRVAIDLPGTVTAAEVIDKRAGLAAGLRRPTGCVWPEAPAHESASRLHLYVLDEPLSRRPPRPWPLAEQGAVSLFQPFPIGVDHRERPVTATLMFASGLVGAVPRAGKTFTLRLLLLAAALDARAELHIYDLKGTGDLAPLAPVAASYRAGDDPDDMASLMAQLERLRTDMRRRFKILRDLPRDRAPEGKITEDLASDPALGLHPIVLAVDETQLLFTGEHGKAAIALVTDLVRRGPAVGIMVWLATQRPSAQAIPSDVSAMAVMRWCGRVMDWQSNDMVLGTGAHSRGVRANDLTEDDRGIGILVGEGTAPVTVRMDYIDGPAADRIVARALPARQAGGRASSLPAGEPDTDAGTVLDHLLAVWPEGDRARLHCTALAARLADRLPQYAGWTGERVTRAARDRGVTPLSVKVGGQVSTGLIRADLVAAVADTRPAPTTYPGLVKAVSPAVIPVGAAV